MELYFLANESAKVEIWLYGEAGWNNDYYHYDKYYDLVHMVNHMYNVHKQLTRGQFLSLRTAALAKMPKRVEFESKLVYESGVTVGLRTTGKIGYYIPFTAPISIDNEFMGKLKVIIEEVQGAN